MEFGAITGYIDLAQILLYVFWLFFAGLIYYLIREGHREGYPMQTDGLSLEVHGWPVPPPKTFKTVHGDVVVPDLQRGEPDYAAAGTYASPGSPIEPTGNPLLAGVGAGAWSNRADVPDMMHAGGPKIVPLRAVPAYSISTNDTDPRGLEIIAGDFKNAGKVVDVWLDQAEMLFRFLEVETPTASGLRRVLVPIPFTRISSASVQVLSLFSHQFADVPGLKNPDQVTFLEEERISAYFGAGTLYAEPSRGDPWI
ncbi:MAG: photosynthetic reaction center subunit H [Hydrogenophaga sp.]